jgi:IMP cyclohydrolase
MLLFQMVNAAVMLSIGNLTDSALNMTHYVMDLEMEDVQAARIMLEMTLLTAYVKKAIMKMDQVVVSVMIYVLLALELDSVTLV